MAYHPFRNLGLKVVSVIMAGLLWMAVARDQVVERTLRAPLEFHNVPDGIEIVGDPPGAVDVRVRGTSSHLGRIEAGEVVAVLDLRGARVGQRLFHLLTDQVRVPFGIQVSQISPPTVSLGFERSASRTLPIVPAVEGTPADGFVVGRVTAIPASVEVTGPESSLRGLTEATTEPISVQNARRTIRDVVTVGVADAALRLREARSASVTIEIVAVAEERTVSGVAVRMRNLAAGLRARVTPVSASVTLEGPADALARLDERRVELFVDLETLGRGTHSVPLRGSGHDAGLTVVRIDPEAVQVTIR